MSHLRTALLVGVTALGVAGLPGLATAQNRETSPQTHVMNVALPGGGTAQIRYTGDVAPRIAFTSGPAGAADWAPMPTPFGSDSPFAMLDRISAEMDREAAALFRQAGALTARVADGQPIEAALRNMPPGSASYSSVSTISGNHVCTQSVEITASGTGAPKVVRHSSGDCGGPQTRGPTGAAGSVNLPAATTPSRRPDTLWIKDSSPAPYRGFIQKTALPQ